MRTHARKCLPLLMAAALAASATVPARADSAVDAFVAQINQTVGGLKTGDKAGARAASMTTQQFAIARERLQAFASTNGNPSSSWRFSASERKVLLARLQQLKAIA